MDKISLLTLGLCIFVVKGQNSTTIRPEPPTTIAPIFPGEDEPLPPGNDTVDPIIVKGERVAPGEIPFHAFLIEYRQEGPFQCGGSLIRLTWVLTAAHCVSAPGSQVEVRLGGTDWMNKSYAELSDRRIIHENYDPSIIANDVALLHLPRAAEGPEIGLVTLAPDSVGRLEDVLLRASGYGNVATGGPNSQYLLKVQLRGITNEECKQTFGGIVMESNLCANWSTEEGQSVCQGDSGGPLALLQNNETYLVGVVSFTASRRNGGCETGRPQGFARITSFRQWIEDNMARDTA